MAAQQEMQVDDATSLDQIGFKRIQLFKDQILGTGSYGTVCKAKCDDLLCAAKYLHSTLFDPSAQHQIAHKKGRIRRIRSFEQEIEFLSTIRHPNIIMYLCTYQDPDSGSLVLLMEFMDDNLTHFLESSPHSILYHCQVNICHDITLALSFLHSNNIVHRDLSSNNVLLIGNVRAKVTDFGIARLDLQKQRNLTENPGTDAYMPPEALTSPPEYTEKIDCFSFGVLIIQVLTQQSPKPGSSFKKVGTHYQHISEIERRQNHINEIDPKHPLLNVSKDCLNDLDVERPSACELCKRIADLKESSKYCESMAAIQVKTTLEQDDRARKDLSQTMNQQEDQQLRQKLQQVMKQDQEKNQVIEKKDKELKEKETVIALLEKELRQLQHEHSNHTRQLPHRGSFKLKWEERKETPRDIIHRLESDAVVDGTMVYVIPGTKGIYAFNSSKESWSKLPICPCDNCSIAVIDNLLTTIGGCPAANKLYSLTGEGAGRRWTERFPPMPTERYCTIAVCTGADLIVAGGKGKGGTILKTVEIMNIETRQWSTAADLPEPQYNVSATICDDSIYMLGGESQNKTPMNSMYVCSLTDLIQSCSKSSSTGRRTTRTLSLPYIISSHSTSVWNVITDLPVTESTCVSFHSRLLAVGGKESNKPTTAIRMYNPISKSWEVISHMTTARSRCYAAILQNNQLMVVGGITGTDDNPQTVELAKIVEVHAVIKRSYTKLN